MTRTLPSPAVYARPDLCPQCWSQLTGTRCRHCGLNLDAPQAWELFQVSTLVDAWLDRRARALAGLRDGIDTTGALPTPHPAPCTAGVPAVYARPDLCPQCWTPLQEALCPACGLRPAGPQADAVSAAARQVDGWLVVRNDLITQLRDASASSGRTVAADASGTTRPQPAPPPSPTPTAPVAQPSPAAPQAGQPSPVAAQPAPMAAQPCPVVAQPDPTAAQPATMAAQPHPTDAPPDPPMSQPIPVGPQSTGLPPEGALPPPPQPPPPPVTGPPWWSGWRVTPQALLLGLGALLVGVAAVIFLVVTWDRLDSDGRSLVLAGATVLTAGLSWGTRRRLPETAEAFGALTVLLVALDVVALRITGMLAPTLAWETYLAAAASVVALGYLGLARVTGLKAFRYGAGLLLPLSPALIGHALGLHAPVSDGAGRFLLGLGGALALLVGAAALGRREQHGLPAVIAYNTAVAAQLVTLTGVVLTLNEDLTWAGALALVIAAVAVGHARLAPLARHPMTVLAGASAAVGVALPVLDRTEIWWLLFAPLAVGALTVLLARPATVRWGGLAPFPAACGAAGVLAVAVVPGLGLTLLRATSALAGPVHPWRFQPGERWGQVAGGLGEVDSEYALAALAGALTGGIVYFLWGRRTGHTTRDVAAAAVGLLAASLPWWYELSIVAVVGVGVVVTVGLVLASRLLTGLPGGRAAGVLLQATGCVLAVLTVIAAWTSEPLAVPATLIGSAGLLFWWSRTRNPLLWVPFTVSLNAATLGTALVADLPAAQFGFPFVWLALLIVPAVVLAPSRWLTPTDRKVLGLCAAGPGGIALLGQLLALLDGPVPDGPMLMTWTCLAALACAVSVAVDPRGHLPSQARQSAVPVAVFCAVAGALSGNAWFDRPDEALAAALPVLLGAGVVRLLWGLGAGADVRSRSLEVSLAVAATVALLAVPVQTRAWPALLVLAAGCAVVATVRERRVVGWAAWALLTLAWWDVLGAGTPRTVELWTAPPALLVLVAGAWAARRDGRVFRPSLLAGSALLILPSALAAVTGPSWRAVAALLVGLSAAAAVAVLRERGSRPVQELGALVSPVLAVALLAGPWARGVTDLPDGPLADLLVVGAAAGLGLLGVGRRLWPTAWSVAAALAVGVLPLIARPGLGEDSLIRTWLCLAVTGGVLAGGQWLHLRRPVRGGPVLLMVAGALLGLSVGAGVLTQIARPDGAAADLVTAPAAVALLVFGAVRMRAGDGSWQVVGPALLLALGPSLLISLGGGSSLRLVLLTVGCAAAVVAGIRLQWLSPIVVGAGLLIVHGVVQLAPWFVQVYATVPRWAHLAVVGTLLLVLGARYEHRMADVRSMRRLLRELR